MRQQRQHSEHHIYRHIFLFACASFSLSLYLNTCTSSSSLVGTHTHMRMQQERIRDHFRKIFFCGGKNREKKLKKKKERLKQKRQQKTLIRFQGANSTDLWSCALCFAHLIDHVNRALWPGLSMAIEPSVIYSGLLSSQGGFLSCGQKKRDGT